MLDFGTVRPGTTLYIPFATYDSNDPSASVTLTGLATTDIEVYKDGSVTQRASDAGYALLDTDGIDFDAITGIHGFSIDLADNTTAGFYAAGSQYWVVVSSVTVDAATVNFIAATFRIGYPDAFLNTTIATLASQTSFTLTAGPADNDALNGARVIVHDVASGVQIAQGIVSDYVGSTRTVTLKADPGIFTMAATDNISFFPAALVPTTAGNTLDVTATGAAGIDWGNVENPSTAVDLAATDIQLCDTITTYTGNTVQTGDSYARLGAPAGASVSADIATVDANVDAILVDTADMQPKLGSFGDLGSGATLSGNLEDMRDNGTTAFDRATHSLQALRDRGDAAWITGGGGSLTQALNIQPVIPTSIDLAGTATVRVGLILVNSLDDLPSTAEITPGTISIHRKAIGGTTWSAVVTDAAMSEQAGMVYYDEVFDSGSGYAEGDSIRVTFKSVSITADTNTYEVCDASGILFQTEMRQTMRGTDSAALASVCTEARLAELDAANLPTDVANIEADTQNLQSRVPAALVGGRMDSSVGAVAAGAITAAGFGAGAIDAAALAADAVAEISDGVWDEVLTAGTHNIGNSAGRRLRNIQDFGIYDLASVWVDEAAGTSTGTVSGEDATVTNRANDFDNAQTVADAVGITSIRIQNGNSITLTAALEGYEIWGNGASLALGSQNIGGTIFRQLGSITGIGTTLGNKVFFEDCIIGNVTLPPSVMQRASLTGTLTIGSAGDFQLRDCQSGVAGSGAPVIDLGGAVGATTISLRRWSGGLTLNNVATGDVVSVDVVSGGTITVNGSGGTVVIRGMCNVVDGSSGAVSITQTSVINMTKINSEVDTAISDAALATAAALATVDTNVDAILVDTAEMQADLTDGGRLDLIFDAILADTNELQTDDIPTLIAALNDVSVANILAGTVTELASVPAASPTLAQAIAFLYMAVRNKRDTTASSDEIHNAAGTVVGTATVSDDAVTFSKTNYT